MTRTQNKENNIEKGRREKFGLFIYHKEAVDEKPRIFQLDLVLESAS